MNTMPCKNCRFYDPLIRNVKGVPQPRTQGRCAAVTVYPAVARDGQVFPEGVARAEEGTNPDPSQVKIVTGAEVQKACLHAQKK